MEVQKSHLRSFTQEEEEVGPGTVADGLCWDPLAQLGDLGPLSKANSARSDGV